MNSEYMVKKQRSRAAAAGITAGIIAAGSLLLSPAGPAAAHDGHDHEVATCAVDSAELRWGVKESFRNYISGSIANGEWITENGVTYETPAFSWANGVGSFASDLSEGSIEFTGDIHFTGHNGGLTLDVSNPKIVFTGPDAAQLVLDMGEADETGNVAYERVVAAKVDLAGYDAGDGSTLTVEEAPVALTAEGADAFNGEYGDYYAGQELDPLALNLAFSGCDLASSEATPAPSEEPEETEEAKVPISEDVEESEFPWLPVAIGGVALIVIGVTTGMLIAGNKKKPKA
ncbi:HtaA domain-containing protein [Leucobacter denitrificans]|uniref:HtaA domain-containing protein n=1 Tax=Leucobacter denitrificans TaxID=683042 RepID=A0A7G9S3P9_9MICO|nr:HtaA domain-containing protein [Leucobacter denitrificans]QNN62474.1 HtaA domain-containing protein [Leucobacter denitrificans]